MYFSNVFDYLVQSFNLLLCIFNNIYIKHCKPAKFWYKLNLKMGRSNSFTRQWDDKTATTYINVFNS